MLKFSSLVGKMNNVKYQGKPTNLFIGDQWSAVSEPQLRENNIKYILNVTPVNVKSIPGITYLQIPMDDSPKQNIIKHLKQIINFLKSVGNENVLIHCQAGRSRSGSVLIAYLMYLTGKPYTEILKIVQKSRPVVQPNEGFEKQLKQLKFNYVKN